MKFLESKKTLWTFGLLTLISQITLTGLLRDLGTPLELLQHQLSFSAQEFLAFLQNQGPQATEQFLSHYRLDFVHPFLYSIFLASALRQSSSLKKHLWLVTLPFVAGFCDLLENTFHYGLLQGLYPLGSPLFFVASVSAYVKWAAVLLSIGAWIWGRILSSKK